MANKEAAAKRQQTVEERQSKAKAAEISRRTGRYYVYSFTPETQAAEFRRLRGEG